MPSTESLRLQQLTNNHWQMHTLNEYILVFIHGIKVHKYLSECAQLNTTKSTFSDTLYKFSIVQVQILET